MALPRAITSNSSASPAFHAKVTLLTWQSLLWAHTLVPQLNTRTPAQMGSLPRGGAFLSSWDPSLSHLLLGKGFLPVTPWGSCSSTGHWTCTHPKLQLCPPSSRKIFYSLCGAGSLSQLEQHPTDSQNGSQTHTSSLLGSLSSFKSPILIHFIPMDLYPCLPWVKGNSGLC